MPPLIFAGAVLGFLLVSVGTFAWATVRGSRAHQEEALELALNRAIALSKKRGEWVSFCLHGGKTTAGRIVEIDRALLIIYVDIRKPKRAPDGSNTLEYATEVPVSGDLAEIDLVEVEHIEVYSEMP